MRGELRGYSAAEYDRWLDGIYAAAVGEITWGRAVLPLAKTVFADVFAIATRDTAPGIPISQLLEAQISISDVERLACDYADSDPTHSYVLSRPAGTIVTPERLGKSDEYEKTAYYNEWAAPLSMERCAAGLAVLSDERFLAFGIHRVAARGPFTPREVALLERIVPHWVRAVRIADLAAATQNVAHAMEGRLARARCGAFVVDRESRVRWLGVGASKLLESGLPVSIDRGRLVVGERRRRTEIARAVRRACTEGQSTSVACGGAVYAEVEPTRESEFSHGTQCVVFVTDLRHAGDPPVEWLREEFGLTPAECDVARLLAKGYRTEEIAERRAVSSGTVRNQMKQILGKLGVSRQADVVRLLARLPVNLPGLKT